MIPPELNRGERPPPDVARLYRTLRAKRESLTCALQPWVKKFLADYRQTVFDTDYDVATFLLALAEQHALVRRQGPPFAAVVLDNDFRIAGVGLHLEHLLGMTSADAASLALWDAQIREGVYDLGLELTPSGAIVRRVNNEFTLVTLAEPTFKEWGSTYYSGVASVKSLLSWDLVDCVAPYIDSAVGNSGLVKGLRVEKNFKLLLPDVVPEEQHEDDYSKGPDLSQKFIGLLMKWRSRGEKVVYRHARGKRNSESLLSAFRLTRKARLGVKPFIPAMNFEQAQSRSFTGVQELVDYVIQRSRENSLVLKRGEPFAAAIFRKKEPDRYWRLVAEGWNSVRDLGASLWHAERTAIWDFQYRTGRMYLDRANDDEYILVSSAQPCAMCSTDAEEVGFKQIIYAASSADVQHHLGFHEGARAVSRNNLKMGQCKAKAKDACQVFEEFQAAGGSNILYGSAVRSRLTS